MKKTVRIIKITLIALLVYIIYFTISFVVIFKTNKINETDLSYDQDEILEDSNQTLYATLIETSKEALDVRINLIEKAQEEIMISYYYYRDDEASKIITGALLKKADEDVKITIIVDGKLPTRGKNFKTMRAHKNIDYYLYEPNSPLLPHRNNNILHDKIITIDSSYGLIGGRNIANRFLLETNDTITEDRDVLIFGSDDKVKPVLDMKEYLTELTNATFTKKAKYFGLFNYKKAKENITNIYEDYLEESLDFNYFINNKIKIDNASFIRSPLNRMNKKPVVAQTVFDLYDENEKMIIQSPYINQSRLMNKHFPYDLKNKNITLLTNNITVNPNFFGITGYEHIKKDLAKNYNLYEYQGANSVHSKTIVIGNNISIIGSLNMDPRSFFLSTESVIIITSKEFNDKLRQNLENYLENSLLVNDDGKYEESQTVTEHPPKKIKKVIVKLLSFISNLYNHMLVKDI